jgi:RNA polymerase sigma factor (sigma-70 family)
MTVTELPSLEEVLADAHTEKLLSGMARTFATTYRGHPLITYDDLYNEGVIGISKALASKTYDPNTGSRFHSYAYHYILNAMSSFCNQCRVTLSASRVDLRERPDEIRKLAPGDIDIDTIDVADGSDDIGDYDVRESLLSGLSNVERGIMIDKFYHGMTYKQLANKYEMSISGVNRLAGSIRDRIRARGIEDIL